MAKHVGVKLPEDLVEVLKSGKAVAVLATFSEKGLPLSQMRFEQYFPTGKVHL